MKRNIWISLATALPLLYVAGVGAQTADGLTPNREDICDQDWIAGAAWGLCNAYCEAMDCELANDADPLTEPNASANACDKVGGRFANLTGEQPPCETPPVACPCAGIPAFSEVLANPMLCSQDGDRYVAVLGPTDWTARAVVGADTSPSMCALYNEATGKSLRLGVTVEEAQACADALLTQAAAAGVVCESWGAN